MRFCPACLKQVSAEEEKCPNCGAPVNFQNEPHQLPVGALLEGRYRIGRVIGQGGFGITYIGRDERLDMRVAVKEYYPAGYVNRYNTVSFDVMPTRGENEKVFYTRRSDFLREARILAQFADDPNIVCVRDFFEGNNTAYIVMEYLEGISLKQYQARYGKISFDQAFSMLSPVMRALGRVHDKGLVHRDINLSNLMLLNNGYVKLLDFGTARSVLPEGDQSLSVILTPGFAPEEQFSTRGKQGPWTDVYALSATIYKLITGITPENSINRLTNDTVVAPSACGAEINPLQERVLMKGMAVKSEYRIRSMQELYNAFAAAGAPDAQADDEEMTVLGPGKYVPETEKAAASSVPVSGSSLSMPELQKSASDDLPTELIEGGHRAPEGKTGGKAPETGAKKDTAKAETGREALEAEGLEALPEEEFLDTPPIPNRKKSRKKGPKIDKKVFIIAGAVLAAALLGVLFYSLIGANPFREKDSSSSYVSSETVTKSMIRAISRDRKSEYVDFYDCVISDDVFKLIGDMKYVTNLSFRECSGFTSADAVAKMPALEGLRFSGKYGDSYQPLNGASLFSTQVLQVKELSICYYDLDDGGAFLQKFPNLEDLSIDNCGGNLSMENCAGMSALTFVSIQNVDIARGDCSALSNCTRLRSVVLPGEGLTDISWMSPLSELSYVTVYGNELKSLTGLENHENLHSLEAQGNALTDIGGLSGCTNLYSIDLSDNVIADISPLSDCVSVSDLNLEYNVIEDVSVLGTLEDLTELTLNGNPLEDASPLASCADLQKLYLNDTRIENLDFCISLIRLTTLAAKDCFITDISGLENTTQIEDLELSGNDISNIEPIVKNADKLQSLLISDNEISDISMLSSCTNIKMLAIDGNTISDIGCTAGMKGLQYFAASGNNISDISALAGHTELSYTDLGENNISDISALGTCTSQKQGLMLQNNQIEDISALSPDVRYLLLSLYGNPITDFAAVGAMANADHYDYIYLSWAESLDTGPLFTSGYGRVKIVETPLDKQMPITDGYAQYNKEHGQSVFRKQITFPSAEEAESDMTEVREEVRENEGILSFGFASFGFLN